MKKTIALFFTVVIALLTLISCSNMESNIDEEELYGTYLRQNEKYPDFFSITLNPDGTYQYYETMISSHIGIGEYTVDGEIITLREDNIPNLSGSISHTYQFKYKNGKLIFLARSSDQFIYVKLPDKAEFDRAE